MCGLASGPRPGYRAFVHQKKTIAGERENIPEAMAFAQCFVPHEKKHSSGEREKHLPIFGPFRASRISFTTRTPNHKSNSRSLNVFRGLHTMETRKQLSVMEQWPLTGLRIMRSPSKYIWLH